MLVHLLVRFQVYITARQPRQCRKNSFVLVVGIGISRFIYLFLFFKKISKC